MTIVGLKPTRQGQGKHTFAVRFDNDVTVRGFTWNSETQQLSGPRIKVGSGWFFIVSLPDGMWQQLRAMLPQQSIGAGAITTKEA